MNTIKFNLSSPLPYLNSKIEKGQFSILYPEGNSYWQLLDEKGSKVLDGNYTFSQEVLATWTDSDDVLIEDLLKAEPWIVKPVEPITPKAIEEVVTVDTEAEVVDPQPADTATGA